MLITVVNNINWSTGSEGHCFKTIAKLYPPLKYDQYVCQLYVEGGPTTARIQSRNCILIMRIYFSTRTPHNFDFSVHLFNTRYLVPICFMLISSLQPVLTAFLSGPYSRSWREGTGSARVNLASWTPYCVLMQNLQETTIHVLSATTVSTHSLQETTIHIDLCHYCIYIHKLPETTIHVVLCCISTCCGRDLDHHP